MSGAREAFVMAAVQGPSPFPKTNESSKQKAGKVCLAGICCTRSQPNHTLSYQEAWDKDCDAKLRNAVKKTRAAGHPVALCRQSARDRPGSWLDRAEAWMSSSVSISQLSGSAGCQVEDPSNFHRRSCNTQFVTAL